YQFVFNGDGTWKIKSVYSNKYWGVPVYGQDLVPADVNAAGAWLLNYSSGIACPSAPDAGGEPRGLDRSGEHLWGYTTGTAAAKQVKIYKKKFVDELDGKVATISSTFANNLEVGQWYVMYDRGGSRGYVYENFSERKLYNTTKDVPQNGTATGIAHYLVRLKDAGNGKYYLQTGVGNYFGELKQSTVVPLTAVPQYAFTVAKINSTNGHFYVQCSNNLILDANATNNTTNSTVVGYGTTVPTAINGNNDWAFYPVTLEDVDESVAIFEDDVTVTRGYQTCGRGNANSLMLRIDVKTSQAISDATFTVNLNAAAQANLSSLYIHETTATEFIANIPTTPKATASVGNAVSINVGNVSAGTHHFWLCATVENDAELGKILEASLKEISYTCLGKSQTLDVSSKGTLSRQGMKVFDQQNFVFKPTTDGSRYYRIPAMLLDKDGNIVVAADKRYTSNSDLGNHRIDVVVKRSTDGGRTWTNPVTVAEGDGSTEAKYGYGDPALVRTLSGKIICLMAAGSKGFGQGQNHVGMVTSTDGGQTWTPVVDITTRSGKWTNNSGMTDFFVTSGKGLCTDDGVLMFLIDADRSSEKNYLLYSTDDGESWTIDGNLVYGAANGAASNEAKLEQMNDGSLLASVRQDGNRGWNTATYTKNANGTVTFNWGKQYRTSDIWGNSCNADILYYSRTTKGAKRDILLHSYINSSGRQSLQLSMSIDGGKSWHDVYNIQPNGSCYSTMQKLNDGTLAIFIEDESYSAGNGYAINFITITKEQIENWCDELENVGVKIVEKGNLNNNAPFGSWNPSTNWANQFTTSAASGTAGVVVSATYNGLNRQYLNGSGTQRVFVMKPSAANAQNDVFTITAPEGYVITGYTIGGYKNAGAENYTLKAENGASVAIDILNTSSSQPDFLNV
ncbi:MAG: exo-alpha-sialidase, partial [Prevotella sp.]|nr:exo-alpha-sialidase [Prevotella sp.]